MDAEQKKVLQAIASAEKGIRTAQLKAKTKVATSKIHDLVFPAIEAGFVACCTVIRSGVTEYEYRFYNGIQGFKAYEAHLVHAYVRQRPTGFLQKRLPSSLDISCF